MPNSIRIVLMGILLIPALLFVSSCKDNIPPISEQFISGGQRLAPLVDTFTNMTAGTTPIQPAYKGGYDIRFQYSQAPVGAIKSEEFGQTSCLLLSQLFPTRFSLPKEEYDGDPLDSVVFVMRVADFLYREDLKLTLEYLPRELTLAAGEINIDSLSEGATLLGTRVLNMQKPLPEIRIKVNPVWAKEMLNTSIPAGLKDLNHWNSHFFGIRLSAEQQDITSDGCMLTLQGGIEGTGLLFYWTRDGEQKSLSLQQIRDSKRLFAIKRNYAGSKLGQTTDNGTKQALPDTVIFLTSFGGMQGIIDFTAVKESMQKKGVQPALLSRAKLEIAHYNDYRSSSKSYKTAVKRLLAYYVDENNLLLPVPDMQADPTLYDGLQRPADELYTLNITLFMQQLLLGKTKENTIYIHPSDTDPGTGRVILSTPSTTYLYGRKNRPKMRLELTYIPI